MTFSIELASVTDRDEIVAELSWNGEYVAEIRNTTDGVVIEIYPSRTGRAWSFGLVEWEQAVMNATRRLNPSAVQK